MNELQVFTNPEFGQVRTVTIEEEPWFVGKDVAVALGYESPRAAVSKKVDPEDKGVSEMETPSGRQQMTIINESGLYALIFGSKLESAKRFKHWVTHDVLPAIRKTGSYSIIPKARALTTDDYMKAAQLAATCRNERLPYRKMFFYGKKCCNGVRWKQSVQNFEGHLFSGTATRRRTVLEQTWKPKSCSHFTLRERGKIRPIDAPHITDRQIHKTLCNEVLIPLYSPSMIYDNGASQKGKGLHWQFKRIKQQLGWHYRRYGREGAVLLLDLKGFFPNASHALLYQRHRELILNPELQNLADTVIQYSPCPTPGRGMPLGVEPSQQEMVALPSKIDQWIKCQARVHCAGHYMDDYYAFFPTVDEAKLMGHEIVRRFEAAGIRVNKRKCKVIPLTKPFRFCKARFTLTETGKIKVNGSRDGVKRARRKLKLFHREFKEGKRSFFDIEQYMECQSAYYRNFNDHGRLLRLRRLYHAIFFGGGQCLESSKPGPVSA